MHETSLRLWKINFSQKNRKIFVNMSQIDNLSLWIEKTCLTTCFKTSSFSQKKIWGRKTFFRFLYFLGVPNQKVESPTKTNLESPMESPPQKKTRMKLHPFLVLNNFSIQSVHATIISDLGSLTCACCFSVWGCKTTFGENAFSLH